MDAWKSVCYAKRSLPKSVLRKSVWIGIINNRLIGPFFLPDRLIDEYFLHFLQEELPILLEDLPLNVRQQLWFQLDGCPAHYSHPVRNW